MAAGNNKNDVLLFMALTLPGLVIAADRGEAIQLSQLLVWVIQFIAVQGISLMAHGASSLTEWAQWKDDSGTPVELATRRLKVVQGLMVSIFAGNVAYYGLQVTTQTDDVPSLILAGVAAYGGDKFLTPILARITGRNR